MAFVRVEQRNAHLAGAVRLEFVNGREGKVAKGDADRHQQHPARHRRRARGGGDRDPVDAVGQAGRERGRVPGQGQPRQRRRAAAQQQLREADGRDRLRLAFTCEEIDYLDSKAEAERAGVRGRRRAAAARRAPSRPRAARPKQRGQPGQRRRTTTSRSDARARSPVDLIHSIEGITMNTTPTLADPLRAQHPRSSQRQHRSPRSRCARRRRRSSPRASTPAAPSATPTSRPSTSCAACARKASSPSWSRRAEAASKARPSSPST